MQNLLEDYRFQVDENDVFRMMGYPRAERVSEPVLEVCRGQIQRVCELADPWGSYREVRIERITRDGVHLESGQTLTGRRVASILRRAKSLKVCLVTLGSPVAVEIRGLIAGSYPIEALALDAAASTATSALMGHLHKRICAEAAELNCGTTIQYGPGYTGWEIRDMPGLFSCLDGESLPVRVNEQLMMAPEKSLLGVVGIVPGERRAPREVMPCRLCDLKDCSVRRLPYQTRSK